MSCLYHSKIATNVNFSKFLWKSPIWHSIRKLWLTINMRALTNPWFSDLLLWIGDGVEEMIDENFICIPDYMFIPYTNKAKSIDVFIDAIYPSLQIYIFLREISSTINEAIDEINDYLIRRINEKERIYYNFDEAEDDRNNFNLVELLNSLIVSGLPFTTFN